jgi:site-specific DNA-methyltransferase (adenine-specific)
MNTEVMFSSATDLWSTPQDLFDKIHKAFNFTLDPCANKDNTKCSKFYTEEDNGLSKQWAGEMVFCNPPYSKIKDWVAKCYQESHDWGNTRVIMLIPARVDTRYFHDYVFKYAKAICFIKGRLKFGDSKNSAPFPSALILFGNEVNQEEIKCLEQFGKTMMKKSLIIKELVKI